MWPGAAGSTTMLGSLFGNGSSQSSFVFAPPLAATHSNCECGPCCLSNPALAVAVRFPAMPASGLGSSPAPEPPASTAAHTVAATVRTDTLSIRILALPLLSPCFTKCRPRGCCPSGVRRYRTAATLSTREQERSWWCACPLSSPGSAAVLAPRAASTSMCGSHSSQRGRYQFQLAEQLHRRRAASTERMIVASISSATATPKPICWNITSSPGAKPAKTATMISAAPVMMPRGRGDAERDRLGGVAGLVVALADPAEQEDLVVHREAEQHREEEERHPGLDRVDLLEAEQAAPTPCWKTSTSSP